MGGRSRREVGWVPSQDTKVGVDPSALQSALAVSQARAPGRPFPVQTGGRGRDQNSRQTVGLWAVGSSNIRLTGWGFLLCQSQWGLQARDFLRAWLIPWEVTWRNQLILSNALALVGREGREQSLVSESLSKCPGCEQHSQLELPGLPSCTVQEAPGPHPLAALCWPLGL